MNRSTFFFNEQGFTFPELVIVMGIVILMLGFITINLVQARNSSSLTTTLDTLITDMKNQQIKAMTGDTEGRGTADSYGIHFSANQYVLFHGTSFNQSDSSNLAINLDPSLSFNQDLFPSGNIIFLQTSGEVSSFSTTSNSIVLTGSNGNQTKTITINKYGIITSVQ